MTFSRRGVRSIWAGLRCGPKYFGRGHTSGDAIVYFPGSSRLFTPAICSFGVSSCGILNAAAGHRLSRGLRASNIYVDYAQGGSFFDWTPDARRRC